LDGRKEAFERYWRRRDVATLPLHFDALRQGHVDYNDPFMRWVIGRMSRRSDLRERLAQVLDRRIDPQEMIPGRAMLGFIGAALLRGRFDVLSGFLRAGKAMGEEARELTERKTLLDVANQRFAAAGPVSERPQAAAA